MTDQNVSSLLVCFVESKNRNWRDGLAVTSTGNSSREPTWQLTVVYDFSSKGSNALFWFLQVPGVYMMYRTHTGKISIYIKISFLKEAKSKYLPDA